MEKKIYFYRKLGTADFVQSKNFSPTLLFLIRQKISGKKLILFHTNLVTIFLLNLRNFLCDQ